MTPLTRSQKKLVRELIESLTNDTDLVIRTLAIETIASWKPGLAQWTRLSTNAQNPPLPTQTRERALMLLIRVLERA